MIDRVLIYGVLMRFTGNNLEKLIFSIILETKVNIFTRYGKPNETIIIDKYLRSRLTFDLAVKVAVMGTTRPLEVKFHMEHRSIW